MRLPRDVSSTDLIRALGRLGYVATRQTGSHVRLTTPLRGQHHITIPRHDPLKPGTLRAILSEVAEHHAMERDALLQVLFG